MEVPKTPIRRQPFHFPSSPSSPYSTPPDKRYRHHKPNFSTTLLPHHTKIGLPKQTRRRVVRIIIATIIIGLFCFFFRAELRIPDVSKQAQARWIPEKIRTRQLTEAHLSKQKSTKTSTQAGEEPGRPRAALISLVRNSELDDLVISIGDLERTFNNKTGHHYPWMFFSEENFTGTFKKRVAKVVSGEAKFLLIEKRHWSVPDWVDMERFADSLEYLGAIGVGKGWMVSYRNMCRWNSGFFFEHEALKDYDYYWRVEPDVRFFCDIDYDPFAFMAKNELKYGFNMNILDDARSFPSLWRQTKKFLEQNPELIHKDADLRWILDLSAGSGPNGEGSGIGTGKYPSPNGLLNVKEKREWRFGEYNGCQFFSNFEIGDLNFFRSDTYRRFFSFLDQQGGFFYERWGDAPVHTLALALFLPKRDLHFFRDIGYQHGINTQCPASSRTTQLSKLATKKEQEIVDNLPIGKNCSCQATPLDENYAKLVPMESPQKKPIRSCLRMFLDVGDDAVEQDTGT